MSVKIEIPKSEQAKLKKQLEAFSKELKMSSSQVLDAMALDVRERAISILNSQGTNNTRSLANSITIAKTFLGARRIGTTCGYGLYVEFGRPPGNWPPPNVIERWAIRKLGVSPKDAKGVAFLISRKIGKEGTSAQPFMRPAFERSKQIMMRKYRQTLLKK